MKTITTPLWYISIIPMIALLSILFILVGIIFIFWWWVGGGSKFELNSTINSLIHSLIDIKKTRLPLYGQFVIFGLGVALWWAFVSKILA